MPPQTPSPIIVSEDPTASGSPKSWKWPPEDENDIYERRRSGERWHSIKKDYPNRSVNALRVRYSTVKAQKVQGHDKPIRRQLESQSPKGKRTPALVQPHSIPSSSALSNVDDTTTVTSYHPQSSSRRTSDPARTEEWILTSPNLQGGHTAKPPSAGVRQEESDTSLANIADGDPVADTISDHRSYKKARLSMEPSNSPAQSFTSCSMQESVQHSTPVVESSQPCNTPADDATISVILSVLNDIVNATMSGVLSFMLSSSMIATLSRDLKARLNNTFRATLSGTFKSRSAAAEAERDRRQVAFVGANQRANEAKQELEKERAKHSAITKSNERRLVELEDAKVAAEQSARDAQTIIISNERRLVELENAKVAAEQSARDAQTIIISKDERLMELEGLGSAAVDREQEVKAINEGLRKTIFEKDSTLAHKERQMKLYDDLRVKLCTEIGKLPEAQRQIDMVLEAIKGHKAEFGRIWKLLNTASPMDKVLGQVRELKTECEGAQPWLDGVVTRLQAVTDIFATFRTRFTSSGPDGSSFDENPHSESIGCKD